MFILIKVIAVERSNHLGRQLNTIDMTTAGNTGSPCVSVHTNAHNIWLVCAHAKINGLSQVGGPVNLHGFGAPSQL